MLCTWSHAACLLLKLAVYIQHDFLEVHPSRCIYPPFTPSCCGGRVHALTLHLLKGVWIVLGWGGLLWIKLLWAFMHKYLPENKIFLWDIYPRGQLLGHMEGPFLVLKETAFRECLYHFYILTSSVWIIQFFLHPCHYLVSSLIFFSLFLLGM